METATPQPEASRIPRSTHSQQREPHRLCAIISEIEEEIVLGWLRPRQRLVEEELAARFETKRHVIREAIAELERLGLVERQANKGATVKVLNQSDVEQIYTIRETLETLAAEQLPLPCDLNLIVALTEIQDVHTRAVNEHDPRSAFRANMRFHETLFKACGNPHLAEAIRTFAQAVHGARSYTAADPNYLRQARDEHIAMIDALQRSDRAQLVRLCKGHIGPSLNAYVDAVLRGTGPNGALGRG